MCLLNRVFKNKTVKNNNTASSFCNIHSWLMVFNTFQSNAKWNPQPPRSSFKLILKKLDNLSLPYSCSSRPHSKCGLFYRIYLLMEDKGVCMRFQLCSNGLYAGIQSWYLIHNSCLTYCSNTTSYLYLTIRIHKVSLCLTLPLERHVGGIFLKLSFWYQRVLFSYAHEQKYWWNVFLYNSGAILKCFFLP